MATDPGHCRTPSSLARRQSSKSGLSKPPSSDRCASCPRPANGMQLTLLIAQGIADVARAQRSIVDALNDPLASLVSWLRLNDVDLLSRAFQLLLGVLALFARSGVAVRQETFDRLKRVVTKSRCAGPPKFACLPDRPAECLAARSRRALTCCAASNLPLSSTRWSHMINLARSRSWLAVHAQGRPWSRSRTAAMTRSRLSSLGRSTARAQAHQQRPRRRPRAHLAPISVSQR